MRLTDIMDLTAEFDLPLGYEDIWGTLSFRNDARVMARVVELNNGMVAEMQSLSRSGWTV